MSEPESESVYSYIQAITDYMAELEAQLVKYKSANKELSQMLKEERSKVYFAQEDSKRLKRLRAWVNKKLKVLEGEQPNSHPFDAGYDDGRIDILEMVRDQLGDESKERTCPDA